jgi:hypothetical protein
MAYESKREPGRKFGSSYVGKRFDSYSGGAQPGETNENEHAEPQHHTEGKVNEPNTGDVTKNVHAEDASVETPEAIVASHGKAHTVHYSHDHDNGIHTVSSEHEDGTTHESTHGSTAEAYAHGGPLSYEAGGEAQNVDVKRMDHKPQQSAKSEEDNFEMPDLA